MELLDGDPSIYLVALVADHPLPSSYRQAGACILATWPSSHHVGSDGVYRRLESPEGVEGHLRNVRQRSRSEGDGVRTSGHRVSISRTFCRLVKLILPASQPV